MIFGGHEWIPTILLKHQTNENDHQSKKYLQDFLLFHSVFPLISLKVPHCMLYLFNVLLFVDEGSEKMDIEYNEDGSQSVDSDNDFEESLSSKNREDIRLLLLTSSSSSSSSASYLPSWSSPSVTTADNWSYVPFLSFTLNSLLRLVSFFSRCSFVRL